MTKSFDFSPQAVARLASEDGARALAEDVGAGDLTAGLVAPEHRAPARVRARESAVICGTLAETGVDRISIGSLTKDVQAMDFSMRIDAPQGGQ